MIHFKHYPHVNDTPESANEHQQVDNLVIIHGLFGNSDNWNSIAQSLSAHCHIYTLDLPNHGQSIDLEHATYDAMAELIHTWMLENKIESCFLLGHSMGGKVAMQFASQYPERLKGLLVADIAPVDYPSSHHDIFDGLKAIDLQQLSNRKEADEILATYEPSLAIRQFLLKSLVKGQSGFEWRINIENLSNNYNLIRQTPPLSQTYEGPTLFIKGENSNYIQAKHKDAILQWFPNAVVKIIPETGHWLHAEKPLPFSGLVKRFCLANG